MKVFTAVMMDHYKMAAHNDPDTLAANTLEELEQKMRQYMIEWSWHINMPDGCEDLTEEQVKTLPLDDLAELFADDMGMDEGYSWSISETEM